MTCYTGKPETLIPSNDKTCKFINFGATQRLPYVIYADIECMIQNGSHIPIAFGYLLLPHPNMHAQPLPC